MPSQDSSALRDDKGVDHARMSIVELVWPLFVENILRTSLMSVDTFMLSQYSAKAVAAMSLVHQYVFFILLIYMMVSIGASILIAQCLGAGKREEAGRVAVASLILVAGVSVVLSLVVVLGARPLLAAYHLDPEVELYARQFLLIYGGLSTFTALNVGQASIVRAWGYSRDPMVVNVVALFITVAGNALCLFGFWGFPVLGVPGVAASTVLSQVVACALFAVIMQRRKEIALPLGTLAKLPRSTYRAVLAIGVPTVGENLSYNVSQIVILSMIARLGTTSLTTFGILLAVLRYVFMPGVSIGSGTQIKVGYLVGAGKHDLAQARVYRYFAVGFLISLAAMLVVAAARRPILGVFSANPEVLGLAGSVLLVAVFHEPCRSVNTIVIPALKGAGDVRFPVYVGIVSMWGVSVLGAWFLGIRLGLGLLGVWLAMAADECLRGAIMLLRWRSGAWRHYGLVSPSNLDAVSSLAAVEQGEGI